jgi:hypothetical protein
LEVNSFEVAIGEGIPEFFDPRLVNVVVVFVAGTANLVEVSESDPIGPRARLEIDKFPKEVIFQGKIRRAVDHRNHEIIIVLVDFAKAESEKVRASMLESSTASLSQRMRIPPRVLMAGLCANPLKRVPPIEAAMN